MLRRRWSCDKWGGGQLTTAGRAVMCGAWTSCKPWPRSSRSSTAAACPVLEALDTSLSSVVRTLAGLEKSLGVRLLNRTTRRISLTEEGRHYVERCRLILAEVQDTEHALNAKEQAPSGLLKVTAPVAFGQLYVAPIVSRSLSAIVARRWRWS